MEEKNVTFAVRKPSITKVEATEEEFEKMGFTNHTPKGESFDALLFSSFWIFSLEKMGFVSSSTDYGKKSITVEEFKVKIRGTLTGKKFGI